MQPPSRGSPRSPREPWRQLSGGEGSPGAASGEPGQRRRPAAPRGAAARPGSSQAAPAAAAAPAARRCASLRLLRQLPRVAGLRGGKARRREGGEEGKSCSEAARGGRRCGWRVGGCRGCAEPLNLQIPPPAAARGASRGKVGGGGWGAAPAPGVPQGTRMHQFGAPLCQLLSRVRAAGASARFLPAPGGDRWAPAPRSSPRAV